MHHLLQSASSQQSQFGVGSSDLCFNKQSRPLWYALKFEKHWSAPSPTTQVFQQLGKLMSKYDPELAQGPPTQPEAEGLLISSWTLSSDPDGLSRPWPHLDGQKSSGFTGQAGLWFPAPLMVTALHFTSWWRCVTSYASKGKAGVSVSSLWQGCRKAFVEFLSHGGICPADRLL
jgi:hypothetical protein